MAVNLRPVSRRALRRYGELWRALQMVGNALDEAQRMAVRAADKEPFGDPGASRTHWSVATPDELVVASRKAGDSLHVLSRAAQKWEAELVSREWRR